ncbi:Retrograde regulation protein 3 [Ceratobasidium theobromae]|uniref:Retrograde regulation protein 3 n=1 Tax=Ceratobasidium theobromae TaxID=1582974 RepID=A0A5N5QMH0_9AGAM|nr:Retrograde regulation protein 3 [Ceratobasidium theobromae]
MRGPVGVTGVDPGCWVYVYVCGRAEVRLLPATMAFYISQPKVRQAGFELPNKQDEDRQPSPTYDPSMYFAHNNFGSPFDAFNRLKYENSVDFADTIAGMISESDARNGHFHANPFDPHQFPHASSAHPILSPAGPFAAFPASAPAPSFFDSADYAFLRNGERADTPSLASPTADSPFSQTAPPLSAPSKRGSGSAASRSRSRGPAASTSRSRAARKRPSISSPSPPPASAVLIPSQNAWYIPSHSDSSFGFALGSHGTPSSLNMPSPKSIGKVDDLAAKQAQILSEKRRRRRESHNAVERRRRDNINEKISELSTLIPECLLTDNPAAPNKDMLDAVDEEGTREGPKANKGMILRKSVDYIKYLQQLVRAQASRNRELESQLSHYRGATHDSVHADSPTILPPSADSAAVDLRNLLPIEDEDADMITSELSSQILATIENRPQDSALGESPSGDEDEESVVDEDERGRQSMRRGRFGSLYPSESVGKSERVDEVDESALSESSAKMED